MYQAVRGGLEKHPTGLGRMRAWGSGPHKVTLGHGGVGSADTPRDEHSQGRGTGMYKGPGVEEAWYFKEQEGSFG